MIADYHIHTHLCKHAIGSPLEYAVSAQALGLTEICFTDHAPSPDGYDPGNRMELDSFPRYREIYEEISASVGIPVLYGIEADYYRSEPGFLEKWLAAQPFDYVLGSVHYLDRWGIDNPDEVNVWKSANVRSVWKEYFTMVSELAGTGLFDSVAHMDLPKKFGYRPPESEIPDIVAPALDSIAEASMAIEINTSGLRRPVHEIYPSQMILSMARERGIPVLFGSDSHRPQDVGADFAAAIRLALSAGYTEYVTYRNRRKTTLPIPVQDKT